MEAEDALILGVGLLGWLSCGSHSYRSEAKAATSRIQSSCGYAQSKAKHKFYKNQTPICVSQQRSGLNAKPNTLRITSRLARDRVLAQSSHTNPNDLRPGLGRINFARPC